MRPSRSRIAALMMSIAAVAAASAGDHVVASAANPVVVQTMDSCKSALSGAVYQLKPASGATLTAGTAGGDPSPRTVSASPVCPLEQGSCSRSSGSCVTFADVPPGDYRLTETAEPGQDSSNPAGYAPCEGGSACQWQAADVTVNPDGSVLAKVFNMYPDGTLVTWPSSHRLYRGTSSDPIVFHDFGLAPPRTRGDRPCDGNGDASDWSTGTPGAHCHEANPNVCPSSPSPHFPWTCMSDPNPVVHLTSTGGTGRGGASPSRPRSSSGHERRTHTPQGQPAD